MKTEPLWHVSIPVTEESEDAVLELLSTKFGRAASIYRDEQRKSSRAQVFVDQRKLSLEEARAHATEITKHARACDLALGPGRILVKLVRSQDWAESWKRHFRPLEIGRALLIKPSWIRRRPRAGQQVVVLDPGLSFGTGQHATTSFCLSQVAAARTASKSPSLLDIGTGSGILAIAAAKLGFRPIAAFDFDPDAVRIAKQNATRNHVGARVKISCQDLTQLPVKSGLQYDMVCANLMADLLIAQARKILNRVAPNGRLVLAGILKAQFPDVSAAYGKLGWQLTRSRREKEWRSGTFVRLSNS